MPDSKNGEHSTPANNKYRPLSTDVLLNIHKLGGGPGHMGEQAWNALLAELKRRQVGIDWLRAPRDRA